MGLETGTYVNDLVATNPLSTDKRSQGDDHLRLIKNLLKASLPGLDHAVYLETAAVNVASATTTNIGAAASNYVNVTGTTTITAFDTVAAGIWRLGKFAGALTLTHDGTSLILPGGANITTAAGDTFLAVSEGSGNWRVLFYVKASGGLLVSVTSSDVAAATLVTESDAIGSNDNDTTWPTTAAVIDYVTGQQTIGMPAGSMTPTTTNGAEAGTEELATNDVMKSYLAFDKDTEEYACFDVWMPKGWDEGTLVAQFAWYTSATSGDVIWGIQAVAVGDDDAQDAAYGTAVEVTDTAKVAANDNTITAETGALTVGGSPGAEELVQFKVYRKAADAGDTLDADAKLTHIKIHYTTDAPTDD